MALKPEAARADVAPRSPVLRLVRNLALLWCGLSLLGLAAAVVVLVYAAGWGCRAPDNTVGWGPCMGPYVMAVPAALASLFTSAVVLLFAQLFYRAGMRREPPAPTRERTSLRRRVADAFIDLLD